MSKDKGTVVLLRDHSGFYLRIFHTDGELVIFYNNPKTNQIKNGIKLSSVRLSDYDEEIIFMKVEEGVVKNES